MTVSGRVPWLTQGFVVRTLDDDLAVVVQAPATDLVQISTTGYVADAIYVRHASLELVFPDLKEVANVVSDQVNYLVPRDGGLDGRSSRTRANVGVLLDLALPLNTHDNPLQKVYGLISNLYADIKGSLIFRDSGHGVDPWSHEH